jgi:hypothetical protein
MPNCSPPSSLIPVHTGIVLLHTCKAAVRIDTGAGLTMAVIWAAADTMVEAASIIWGLRWGAWFIGVNGSSGEGNWSCNKLHV